MSDEANVQVHCQIGGEPCQSMCDVPCGAQAKPHDPNHPYVRRLVGCGHGVFFQNYCRDCEIVGLREQYRMAVQTVMRVRNRLRALGEPEAVQLGCEGVAHG